MSDEVVFLCVSLGKWKAQYPRMKNILLGHLSKLDLAWNTTNNTTKEMAHGTGFLTAPYQIFNISAVTW